MKKKIDDEIILAYALKNALEHDGEARTNSVLNSLFTEGLEKSEISNIINKLNDIVREVNQMGISIQKVRLSELENLLSHRKIKKPGELPKLPKAKKGKVIMRFRPAPSGPLHVGHIISNLLSSLLVKKHEGKFYVVIDDTNPEETLLEAYAHHKKDCDWIFGNVTKYTNSSDNIKKHYSYAEKIINKKKAYVCTCKQGDFKKLVDKKKECPCRGLDVKENMVKWAKMLDQNGYKEGEAVLRFKSNIKDPNPAMRDFPLARINLTKHPKQGTKYRVWPLMNLAVTVDDIELGVTHTIRGKDHKDNAIRQEMIYKVLGKKAPWKSFMGRIKFTDLVLSKRKIEAMIKQGKYSGWDDPKLATISSLRKRGYAKEAFDNLVIERGLTEVDKVLTQKDFFELLDKFNNQIKQK